MSQETLVDIKQSKCCPKGLTRLYVCQNPLTRLRGAFFRKKFDQQHGVWLRGCSSVHSVGLRKSLEVIFLDKHNCVVSIKLLRPFSLSFDKRADSVLELCVGCTESLNIRVGCHIDFSPFQALAQKNTLTNFAQHEKGASMVEFIIVAPLLIFLGMGVIQMGLVYHARNILDYATFEAARSGAVHQGSKTEMKKELAYRLGPIFRGDGSSEGVRTAVGQAIVAVNNPLRTELKIINPTAAAFDDFGVRDPETGDTVLPNAHLQHRSSDVGVASGVTIQDANLLKIEVTHGYELKFPWFDMKLPGVDFVLKELMVHANPVNASYYLQGQIPISAVATVRMQSRAIQNNVIVDDPGSSRPTIEELDLGDSEETTAGLTNPDETADAENTECVGEHGLPNNLAIESITGVDSATQCAVPSQSTHVESNEDQAPVFTASTAESVC